MKDPTTDPSSAASPRGSERVWLQMPPCRPQYKVGRVAHCIGKTVKSIEFVDMSLEDAYQVEGTREAVAFHFEDGTTLGFRIGGFENHLSDGTVSLDLVPFWKPDELANQLV